MTGYSELLVRTTILQDFHHRGK